jgi:hypothetical protein
LVLDCPIQGPEGPCSLRRIAPSAELLPPPIFSFRRLGAFADCFLRRFHPSADLVLPLISFLRGPVRAVGGCNYSGGAGYAAVFNAHNTVGVIHQPVVMRNDHYGAVFFVCEHGHHLDD